MALNTVPLICSKHLPFRVSNCFVSTFFKELNQCKVKYTFVRLCHLPNSSVYSDLLDREDVQKYLTYIQTDTSSVKHICGSRATHLDSLLSLIDEKKKIESELENLKKMSFDGDKELEKLINEEKITFKEKLININSEILGKTVIKNRTDEKRSVEMQIVPAVGGSEAKLFAKELHDMYLKYISYKNWECISEIRGTNADLRSVYFLVSGYMAYNLLKNEAGVHRVQRVPATEKFGRTQTSTCSIIVFPQPEDDEIVIKEKDLIIETIKSSGPGGQNIQKNETCVRIKHIPTGIIVVSQVSRYQYENKSLALKKLKGILFNMEQEKQILEKKITKKKQVGTNDYSDKVRTYNFIQNRVTDHRINYSNHNLKGFFSSERELDNLISKLNICSIKKELLEHIEQVLQSTEYKKFAKNCVSN